MRIFPLFRDRTARGGCTLIYLSPFYASFAFFLLPLSLVMASVHIIVDGENANRENAEYAVWQ